MDNKDKFNLLTHHDLDGAGCAILIRADERREAGLHKVFNCGYHSIEKNINRCFADGIENIVTTDLALEQHQLENLEDISKRLLVIDHHPSTPELKSGDKTRIVFEEKMCGTEITHREFKTGPEFDTFVQLVGDYDLFRIKHKESLYLNELFWDLGFWDFCTEFSDGSIKKKHMKRGKALWEEKEKRYAESEKIIVEDTIILFDQDLLTVAMLENPKNIMSLTQNADKMSIRSNESLFEFFDFLEANKNEFGIISVGGHRYAGGISFNKTVDVDKIESIYEQLEKYT